MTAAAEAAAPMTNLKPQHKRFSPLQHPRVRGSRLTGILKIAPSDGVAVIYKSGTSLEHVLESCRQIVLQLENQQLRSLLNE